MTTHLTVIGATGGIGSAILRAAEVRADVAVRAVNRGGNARTTHADTERVAADIETTEGAHAAVAGTDVVVMAAQPPYHAWGDGRFERMVQHLLDATTASGAKFVMVDNLYAFDNTVGPMSEASPTPANRKAVLREALAQQVLAHDGVGGTRVTIGCFADYVGPHDEDGVIQTIMGTPARRGRRMRALYELDVPHTYAFTDDMARMFLVLALDPRADGRRWVLPHGEPVTQRELMALVAEVLGVTARIGRYGPLLMWLGGRFDPDVEEVRAVRDQWEHPYLVDGSAFVAEFGPQTITPLREALRRSLTTPDAHQEVAA